MKNSTSAQIIYLKEDSLIIQVSKFSGWILSALVILLQFQGTLHLFGYGGSGLRISAADFLLPIAIGSIIWSLRSKSQPLPVFASIAKQSTQGNLFQWQISWLPLWFLTFTTWLGISLGIGYLRTGDLSSWGLVNKFLGWFILMGYFLIGGWLGNQNEETRAKVLKALFLTSWSIGLLSLINLTIWSLEHWTNYYYVGLWSEDKNRLVGFLENPNAFAMISLFIFLLHLPIFQKKLLFPNWLNYCGMVITLLCLFSSGSRGISAALPVGIIVFLVYKIIPIRFMLFILGTIAISFVILIVLDMNGKQYFLNAHIWKLQDPSITDRLETMTLALNWWLENPFTGMGLGGFISRSLQENITPVMVLHQTFIWLLTETGVIGLGLILIFFISLFETLSKICKGNKGEIKHFPSHALNKCMAHSGIAILASFAVASLTTEVMYQRYLWLLFGMLLVKRNLVHQIQ